MLSTRGYCSVWPSKKCVRDTKRRRFSCAGSRAGVGLTSGNQRARSGRILINSGATGASERRVASRDSLSSRVRRRSSSGAKGIELSCSKQWPCRKYTCSCSARALTSATRRDLPMPASPDTRRVCPCPLWTCANTRSNDASDSVRPMRMGHTTDVSNDMAMFVTFRDSCSSGNTQQTWFFCQHHTKPIV